MTLQIEDFAAVVLDIEGTTTPLAFVHEVLFPFAATHVEAFLEAQWSDDDVRSDAAAIADSADNDDALPNIDRRSADSFRAGTLATVRAMMAADLKDTGLKSLQGKIWRHGYHSGELQASLFPDVADALRAWHRFGITLHIYSSGSIAAQKLLFGHTNEGDLRPLLSGYFDTTTGPKRSARSYAAIAEQIGEPPEKILFLTDVAEEAAAADTAGFATAVMKRPGNKPQPEHDFPILETFQKLMPRRG